MKLLITLLALSLSFFVWIEKGHGQTISTGFVAGSITTCQGAESANEAIQYFTSSGFVTIVR